MDVEQVQQNNGPSERKETPGLASAWLPDECILKILDSLPAVSDRSSFSQASHRFKALESRDRAILKLKNVMMPAQEVVMRMCARYLWLTTLHLDYFGWNSRFGPQLNNSGLATVAQHCRSLVEIYLRFCTFITDAGLAQLASCSKLRAVSFHFTPGITGRGLMSLVSGCQLASVQVVQCMGVRSSEWLEMLGRKGGLRHLAVSDMRGIGEGDLAKLGAATWEGLDELHFKLDVSPREVLVYPIDAFETLQLQELMLRVLHLRSTPRSCREGLAGVLLKCRHLTELHLDASPGVRDEDLAQVVHSCQGLRHLHLSTCDSPGDAYMGVTNASLAMIAPRCGHLESLRLCNKAEFPNRLSFLEEGVVALLEGCASLRSLHLEKIHDLSTWGLQKISQVTTLERLHLHSCYGIMIRRRGLAASASLAIRWMPRELELTNCLLFDQDLCKLLQHVRPLEHLTIRRCPSVAGKQGVKELARQVTTVWGPD